MSDIATSDSVHGAAREKRGAHAEARAAAQASAPVEAAAEAQFEGGGFWPRLLGVAWVAAVLSYVWGRYDLPFAPAAAWAAARDKISQADWLIILAAILGPLAILALAGSLLRGSRRLSAESRSIAETARRMSDQARAAAPRGEGAQALMGEVEGASPAHIRREVERATHAIGALHEQMRAIEEALASQSAALDQAAERAEARVKTIAETLGAERKALQGLLSSIEAEGGRALNLVALRPDDLEKTQRTLDALKSQSDSIERTVEAAGLRLNAIAADIQQALRKAGPADAETLAEGARASVREAAHHAIDEIGETEAATRARLYDGVSWEQIRQGGGAAPAKADSDKASPAAPDEEAADLRRRNLTALRQQMDRLRRSEEEAPASIPARAQPSRPGSAQLAPAQPAALQPGQGLAARLAAGAAKPQDSAGEAARGPTRDPAPKAEAASPSRPRVEAPFAEPDFGQPQDSAAQPPVNWEAIGDFDVDLVETEPLDRDAAALAARSLRESEAAASFPPPQEEAPPFAPPEEKARPAAKPAAAPLVDEIAARLAAEPLDLPPIFTAESVPSDPAPLFGEQSAPRPALFDPARLAPLADLNIPSPLAGSAPKPEAPPAPAPEAAAPRFGLRPPEEPAAEDQSQTQTQTQSQSQSQSGAPILPVPPPSGGEGSAGSAARGWLGAAAPGEAAPAGGLDSFGERREVEAGPAASPPGGAPRPSVVWRQPETPMFGPRSLPRPKPLDWGKVALGLNFPVSEEDSEAEEALYEVSIDHQIGALIQASEDMLAALVDLRLYMEDHAPRVAPSEVWRNWLDGRVSLEDPPVIEIGPQEALNRVRDLIDHDPAVERLAVSFAGRFEDLVRRALDESSEPDIVARLADTRTGRAYAMVACAGGRVE